MKLLIAGKNQTPVEALLRANGMMSNGLQPGDHLIGLRERDYARRQKSRPAPVESPREVGDMAL